jgi:ABC-type multidrug transport system fused ATPase/permease subunit
VSFLLPIFTIILVKEKEERIFIMMQMNGLKSIAYFLTHYAHFYSLHLLSSTFFLFTGWLVRMDMFVKTDLGVLVLIFFIWGHVQIALAFFFSTIFNKSRNALVMVFLFVLCGVIISLATSQLFRFSRAPLAYFVWPPFAFYRILSIVNISSYAVNEVPYTMSRLVPGDEVFDALMFLIGEIFVYAILAYYLSTVLPSEFGVPRKWYWPIERFIEGYNPAKKKVAAVNEEETGLEDEDVKTERARVLNAQYNRASPLVMKGMRKVYESRQGAKPKIAVKDVTLAVENGLVFGLLGPNGAGKTTLISILTGVYHASGGRAYIAGFDINKERQSVYQVIGICPQVMTNSLYSYENSTTFYGEI